MRNQPITAAVSAAMVFALLWVAHTGAQPPQRRVIHVSSDAELRQALRQLAPGLTISIAPGEYTGGIWVADAVGTAEQPIIIEGADPERPPVFVGGGSGIQFSRPGYLILRHLVVRGARANGISISDGGQLADPARHIVLEDLSVLDTGPQGNHDGIKLSGVADFVIRRVTVEGWGGSAVDMVGCHNAVIENSHFLGKEGFRTDNGVQAKGGSRDILIQSNFFRDAGNRGVQYGGHTGLQFFRPAVGDFEARDLEIAGNRFVRGLSAVAFASSHRGRAHRNTIYLPQRWPFRILQDHQGEPFKPTHDGLIEHNLIVFDRSLVQFVNIGPGTAPETFTFRRNAWFSLDRPRTPNLPTDEIDGIYQVDPQLSDAGTEIMRIGSDNPRLNDVGADAYTRNDTAAHRIVPWAAAHRRGQ